MTVAELKKILSVHTDDTEICIEDFYRGKKLFLATHKAELESCNSINNNLHAFKPTLLGHTQVLVIKS